MSHPVLWPKKVFFYPFGNTPPVCLTQELAPEQSANVLLLGCGDPRSILFTLYASLKLPSMRTRTLDFTCCDFEPAILARNALLFTLIVDGHPIDCIWNIFYHFKLDNKSLSLLISQCEKLVSMSIDVDSWSASPYSAFLRVCSTHTLLQLHNHWKLYARSREFLKDKNEPLFSLFHREFQTRNETNMVVCRSAGPLSINASQQVNTGFKRYWRTGTTFLNDNDIALAEFINPTFVHSQTGEECALHYSSFPLHSFLLDSASLSMDTPLADLIACARLQFRQWCDSFKTAVSPASLETIIIRLFAGDALAFCHTLYHCCLTSSTTASLFVSPWAGTELNLDGGDYCPNQSRTAPTMFNVIDTSNIADHVGLINVLLVAVPLLCPGSSSSLYTATFSANKTSNGLTQRLCADIAAMSLLLGITPVAYISGFVSYSDVHELQFAQAFKSEQYREQITWKIPHLGDHIAARECGNDALQLSYESLALAKLLFDVYYRMFEDEDIGMRLRTSTIGASIMHYHRGTFAALLGFVKSKLVDTDWNSVMGHIYDLLHADKKLILGSNNYQELCCQLHIRGIYSVDTLQPGQTLFNFDRTRGRFEGWRNVPPVICLILVVPREKLRIVEGIPSREMGSPMLLVEIRTSTFHNVFSSIQATFGSVSIKGTNCNASAILHEDMTGWSGSSSLVVSVWVPSFNLSIDPARTRISLGFKPTPDASRCLRRKLGLNLELFTINLMETDFVHVVSQRPHHPDELMCLQALMARSPHVAFQRVSVGLDNTRVSTLGVKREIENIPMHDSANAEQVSPCTIKVSIGQISKTFVFPFPIDGKQPKLRIARQSGWIEVVATLSEPQGRGGFTIKRFPVFLPDDGVPIVWNVHHLSLEQLPIIDVGKIGKDNWVSLHASYAFSDRERSIREQENPSVAPPVLVEVKDTLHSLLTLASQPNAQRIFGLKSPSCVYAIIFLNHLRHDLASSTIVADTCVLPLTPHLVGILGKSIDKVVGNGRMMDICTSETEALMWKQLFPVIVERCRAWSHTSSCQYNQQRRIPLSTELDQNPICGCGEGKNLGAFAKVPQWKSLAKHVTRAAISPLFAVSYVETVLGFLKETPDIQQKQKGEVPGSVCAYCGSSGQQKLQKCSRCQKTTYCGKTCQLADWKQHKNDCIVKK